MRLTKLAIVFSFAVALCAGCTVYTRPEPVVVESDPPSYGPVVEGPGVEIIEVEPAPVERVYVYDPGYPPGTYFYHGYYYYGGYRYERDVFVHRYVEVNVREHRYADADENRMSGRRFEEAHRAEYARTGGVRETRSRGQARPEAHEMTHQQHAGQYAEPNAHRQERAEPRPQPHPQQGPPRQQGGRNEQ